jgi:hypothetical protein
MKLVHNSSPSKDHCKQLLRYLQYTKGYVLTLGGTNTTLQLEEYSNSGFATDIDTMRNAKM